jgi:hypothetical protein
MQLLSGDNLMKYAKSLVQTAVLLSLMCESVFAEPMQGNSGSEGRRGPPPFSSLDLNGDSSVTLSEFEQHKIPHGDHSEVFSHIDANDDGAITETEFTNHKPPRRRQ